MTLRVVRCEYKYYCPLNDRLTNDGRSKSLGNVIDPLDVIAGTTLQALQDKLKLGNLDEKELKTASDNQVKMFPQGIPECGVDALRFSLINYTTGGK